MEKEEILKELMKIADSTESEYGEPQLWLYLESGRSIEITLESYCIPKEKQFFSIRLHCSDDEFDDDVYKKTCGIIELRVTDPIGDDLEKAKKQAFERALDIIDVYQEEISRKG